MKKSCSGCRGVGAQHIAIGMGSTQLTHDLFRTLLDPGDTVMLLDPTYANYEGQLAFSVPGVKIVRLRVLDPQTWSYLPETDPAGIAHEFSRLFDLHRPRMVLFGAPDNPTSQVVPQALADLMLAKTFEAGAWLVIDAAYKCQYFQTPPAYYAWSPADHPNVVGIHSNSKWARGLGRRLGWIEAQESVVEAIERVQQCSILCPDTLSQMAMARYLKSAIPSGSLKRYVADANALYKNAADVTLKAIDTHLQRPRLTPFGGLYTCVDIGTNAEEFVPKALKATGVLVVPGGGFGESLTNGVRISFGPLVKDTPKIEEGLARLGDAGCDASAIVGRADVGFDVLPAQDQLREHELNRHPLVRDARDLDLLLVPHVPVVDVVEHVESDLAPIRELAADLRVLLDDRLDLADIAVVHRVAAQSLFDGHLQLVQLVFERLHARRQLGVGLALRWLPRRRSPSVPSTPAVTTSRRLIITPPVGLLARWPVGLP